MLAFGIMFFAKAQSTIENNEKEILNHLNFLKSFNKEAKKSGYISDERALELYKESFSSRLIKNNDIYLLFFESVVLKKHFHSDLYKNTSI